jgi:rhamnulokinase
MLGILDRGLLTLHELHRFTHRPIPSRGSGDGLQWDLPALWNDTLQCARRAVAECDRLGIPLASIGVDTWGVDFALLGVTGEPLAFPYCYRDPRFARACARVVSQCGATRLYDETGIQIMPFNTLFQLCAMRESEPGALATARRLLFMPDLFHYMLTGVEVNELSIASTSQMIRAGTSEWSESLVNELGLPRHCLGTISPPGTVVGPLRDDVARTIGARHTIQVVLPASHDTASAIAAIPATPDSRWAYLSSGTWSLMGCERDAPILSERARLDPFTNEQGVGGTIRFLKNISGLWLVQECKRAFEAAGVHEDYATLVGAASSAPPFRTLVDVDWPAFASPGEMPEKIRSYAAATDQAVPGSPAQLIRCCLESLALKYGRTHEALREITGTRFDTLHVVGGGGKNDLLNRMTADATGLRVVVGPFEATAMGNILVQAMGMGEIANVAAIREISRASTRTQVFTPGDSGVWQSAAIRYAGLVARSPGLEYEGVSRQG